jgi:hypothetical protein
VIEPPEEEIETLDPVVIFPAPLASESDQSVTDPPVVIIETELFTVMSPAALAVKVAPAVELEKPFVTVMFMLFGTQVFPVKLFLCWDRTNVSTTKMGWYSRSERTRMDGLFRPVGLQNENKLEAFPELKTRFSQSFFCCRNLSNSVAAVCGSP